MLPITGLREQQAPSEHHLRHKVGIHMIMMAAASPASEVEQNWSPITYPFPKKGKQT